MPFQVFCFDFSQEKLGPIWSDKADFWIGSSPSQKNANVRNIYIWIIIRSMKLFDILKHIIQNLLWYINSPHSVSAGNTCIFLKIKNTFSGTLLNSLYMHIFPKKCVKSPNVPSATKNRISGDPGSMKGVPGSMKQGVSVDNIRNIDIRNIDIGRLYMSMFRMLSTDTPPLFI